MTCAFSPDQYAAMGGLSEKTVAADVLGYCPHQKDDTTEPEKSILQNALSVVPAKDLYCLAPDFNPIHIRKVVKEGILLAAGGVAILLQVAAPGIAAGVNNDSNFAYRVVDRLRTTMTYVYCMVYGTPRERAVIIEMVHRAHVPVHGDLGNGERYTANDPHLQLWVAATLYVSGVDIWEKIFGKLDDKEADRVFQEYAVIACSLRVPVEMWPKSHAEFWTYWDENIETLVITDHARAVAKDLLYNKHSPLWIRSALPLARIMTTEWLPPRMRDAYGLKSTKAKRVVYRTAMGYAKMVYPRMPLFIREFPLRFYLKDMRKRMDALERKQKSMAVV